MQTLEFLEKTLEYLDQHYIRGRYFGLAGDACAIGSMMCIKDCDIIDDEINSLCQIIVEDNDIEIYNFYSDFYTSAIVNLNDQGKEKIMDALKKSIRKEKQRLGIPLEIEPTEKSYEKVAA